MHKIYMGFQERDCWHVYFMLPDLKTQLPRKIAFSDPKEIIEMAKRGGMEQTSESKSALDHGISIGRGGCWLSLTDEQFNKLTIRPTARRQ